MKKIVFLLMILLPMKVMAVSNFQITETPYTICDEKGKLLKVHFLRHNYYSVYYFNYNQNYNYNFNEYYEFNDDYYEEIAHKYLWIYPVVNYKTFYNYHQQFITRYLWENMYPEKTFSFCNEEDSIIIQKEIEYEEVKTRVNEVINGLELFLESHYQKPNEITSYEHQYLPLYDIVDTDGLDVTLVKNKLTIVGTPGEYDLTFQIKDNNAGDSYLFTDGVNVMANLQKSPSTLYKMHIVIEPYILTINLNNGDNNQICFILENENDNQEECAVNNTLSFKVNNGQYHLSLKENIFFEDYQEDLIINDNKSIDINLMAKEEVFINETEDNKETITFVAKDTFSFN